MNWDVHPGSGFFPSRIRTQGRDNANFVFIKGESGTLCAQDNLGIRKV
jgi:hypothetical protein